MSLHNDNQVDIFQEDEPVDGDVSHIDQQTGSRKTRVLPGPNDNVEQLHIDEAIQLANQHTSTAGTPQSSQQSQSISSNNAAPASAAASAPAPASEPSDSQLSDGFTVVPPRGRGKGNKGKGKPNAGSAIRHEPYKKSSS